ncbi:hypothetical protein JCM10212_004096 [Sporobolomyces blumeae]
MPSFGWVLNKVILVSTAFLIGAFFPHWVTDYALIWQGPLVSRLAVDTSLQYYNNLYNAPPYYVSTLSLLAALALVAATTRLVLKPVSGLLFDGATLLLLLSALSVYVSNVLAALRYLPLSHDRLASPALPAAASLDSLAEVRLVEALQSVAASHMIIAVSLTGVLMLQGAQGFADRPTSVDRPVAPSTGVVPSSDTVPVPTRGESEQDSLKRNRKAK